MVIKSNVSSYHPSFIEFQFSSSPKVQWTVPKYGYDIPGPEIRKCNRTRPKTFALRPRARLCITSIQRKNLIEFKDSK